MKIFKFTAVFIIMIISLSSFSGCSFSEYKDGVYSAQAADFAASGWKEILEITIKNGAITKIDWDAIYKDDSIPIRKKQYSKSGLYGMLVAGAVDEWYGQATAAEQFVIDNGIDALKVKDDGYTDVVTGCTIHVIELKQLLTECLEQAKINI